MAREYMRESISVEYRYTEEPHTYERVAYTPKTRRAMRAFLASHRNSIYSLNTKNSVAYGFFANSDDPDLKEGNWKWGGFIDVMPSLNILWDYIVPLNTGRLYKLVKQNKPEAV